MCRYTKYFTAFIIEYGHMIQPWDDEDTKVFQLKDTLVIYDEGEFRKEYKRLRDKEGYTVHYYHGTVSKGHFED